MAKINLLPWRAELRKEKQKEFVSGILAGIVVTAGIMLLVHSYIQGRIDYQNHRNQFLKSEITALDQRIKEIQELETQKKKLIAKMEVIQQLQASRPEIVHLFDELARTIPEGVSLIDLAQSDKELKVNGISQSNARVSAYMRNLEASSWLKDPRLNIIEAKRESKETPRAANRFTLQVRQAGSQADSGGQGQS